MDKKKREALTPTKQKGGCTMTDAALRTLIARRLREEREAKGLTLEAVGNAIGTTRQSVFRFESGKHWLTIPKLFRLAEALGTTPKFLIFGLDAGKQP